MKLDGLSRQIALTMGITTVAVTLLTIITSYGFYYLAFTYWPGSFDQNTWMPTGSEWIWLILAISISLASSVSVAISLARRILVPLNSVADGIRRVAHGDLSARAIASDRSLSEVAELADDFNLLADQLQRVTSEQAFWNAAIAHELRTPVTVLRGRLQGLAEGVFMPDETLFRSLLVQVEGLVRLIEDMRVISLAESGHLDLQMQQADLAAEVRAVVDVFGDALQKAHLTPELELNQQSAYCDPVRIRQALLALLENARRYAVPGAIRIRTGTSAGQCYLQVEDDGPGIPAEFASKVFEAFWHAGHVRPGEGGSSGGNGLGLAIVAAIAHAHGGQAVCLPAASGGTRFELRWPCKAEVPQPVLRNLAH